MRRAACTQCWRWRQRVGALDNLLRGHRLHKLLIDRVAEAEQLAAEVGAEDVPEQYGRIGGVATR